MKLIFYRGSVANFGDELNPWMWPQIFPGMFNSDEGTVFLGIGSIIGMNNFPPDTKKIVFGSAFVPEYFPRPDMSENWRISFVRGPRTAALLGLDPRLGMGDPAVLLRPLLAKRPRTAELVGFMPHWESLERGQWKEAAQLAGITLIDPSAPVETILDQLCRTRLLITEAMHGAIVADALRIPWVPVLPLYWANRAKWADWADTVGVKLRPYRAFPSTLREARLSALRKPLSAKPLKPILESAMLQVAASRLSKLSRAEPILSADQDLDRCISRITDEIEAMKKERRAILY